VRTRRRFMMLVTAAAGCLALTGAALVASPGGAAGTKPQVVRLGEYFFRPGTVTVRVGQPVVFVNVGKIEHTVADTDAKGTIRSRLIKPHPLAHGARQQVVFRHPGTVHYLCTFHPTLMRGRLVVRR
jgi:plastocyanin